MNPDLALQLLRDTCPDGSRVAARRALRDELVVTIPPDYLLDAAGVLKRTFDLQHLSTITGQVRDEKVELLYHFWDEHGLTLQVDLPVQTARIDSLTPLLPGAALYERELQEMLNVEIVGHPNPRPLFLPDDWDEDPPLLQECELPITPLAVNAGDASPLQCGDGQRIVIPIGPQHPALKEPIAFQLLMEGERIIDSVMRIGYVHRGIERLAQTKNYVQNMHLVERVCGICSHIHATTYCQALEALIGVEIPRRAEYIRALMCEMERIHSHMLWLGALAESIGFTTIFMYAWRDREMVLDIMEAMSGQRVSHAVNVIGGVRTDVDPDQVPGFMRAYADLETQLQRFLDIVEHDRSFRGRTRDVGRLSDEQIRGYCVVGPMARASGTDVDMRRDVPYAAYGDLDFKVIKDYEGDVWARTMVRLQETIESVHICRQILGNLPDGPLTVKVPRRIPEGEVIERTEAPRGELLYYVRSDGSDRPARLKIRTPTLTSLITLHEQFDGVNMADVPTVLGGMDLCIACADR